MKIKPPWVAKKGANTKDLTGMSLIRILSEGPEVSLRGSPIVSPTKAALWASDPLGPSAFARSLPPACKYHIKVKKKKSKGKTQRLIQREPLKLEHKMESYSKVGWAKYLPLCISLCATCVGRWDRNLGRKT